MYTQTDHTHTRADTDTQIHTHSDTHTQMLTDTHILTQIQTHTQILTHGHTHLHRNTHTQHRCIHTHKHTLVHINNWYFQKQCGWGRGGCWAVLASQVLDPDFDRRVICKQDRGSVRLYCAPMLGKKTGRDQSLPGRWSNQMGKLWVQSSTKAGQEWLRKTPTITLSFHREHTQASNPSPGTSLQNPDLGWEMDELESVYWTNMRTWVYTLAPTW